MEMIRLDREFELFVTKAEDGSVTRIIMTQQVDYPWISVKEMVHKDHDVTCGIYLEDETGLRVILSYSTERDGKIWQHVSVSREGRVPSYEELCMVKETLVGPEKGAVQVFPPKEEHVNYHPYCLHLWHCCDGNPLPDFRREGKV